jgi:RNA-directed DNA polymerase
VNAGAPWPEPKAARERVLEIQRKLHKWASDDQDRRFSDLYNLVCDPATLMVAWTRVRANRGSRSAGVDGQSAAYVEQVLGVQRFLTDLRQELRSGSYRQLPVKERKIPKRGGKLRRLGIATVRDRVVQAAVKLVLEPIFEVDFQPCSYGFRPGRRAQDAIAEVHFFTTHSYEWIVEADIEACFDRLDHVAIMDRVRARIADKRVLGLVKAFLKAGIMSEHGGLEAQLSGTPQGGILSPLLSNIALSALDQHYARAWKAMGDTTARAKRRRHGEANYRLIRYADLCRRRHKSAYAEERIMPSGGRDASSEAGIGSRSSA